MSKVEAEALKACVRVRPFVSSEQARAKDGDLVPILEKFDKVLSIAKPGATGSGVANTQPTKDSTFTFDEVFWSCQTTIPQCLGLNDANNTPKEPIATQVDVFESIGAPTVKAVLDGYNACIFAYGQTGSGKSHSIIGSDADPGLSPRIMAALFQKIKELEEKDKFIQCTVELAVVEIYNEKPSDLLALSQGAFNAALAVRSAVAISHLSTGGHHHHGSGGGGHVGTNNSGRLSRTASGTSSSGGGGALKRRGSVSSLGAPTPRHGHSRRNSIASESDIGDEEAHAVHFEDEVEHHHHHDHSSSSRSGSKSPSPRNMNSTTGGGSTTGETPDTDSLAGTARAPSIETLGGGGGGSRQRSTQVVSIDVAGSAGGKGGEQLRVRQHPLYGTFLSGLRREVVDSEETARIRLHRALNHRTTASTKMNDQSSRSHAMVQLFVQQENRIRGVSKTSAINIIDLAGSERVKLSGVTGQQMREAQNINLSLTTLRRVIDTMLDNQERMEKKQPVHKPPYRDSLLTHLLSDSLGGNSKTTMMATVSPHKDYYDETLGTLRYASRARSIVCKVKVNKTQVQTAVGEVQHEVDSLKNKLKGLQESDAAMKIIPGLRHSNEKKQNVNNVVERRNAKKRAADDELRGQVEHLDSNLQEWLKRLKARQDMQSASLNAEDEKANCLREVTWMLSQLEKNKKTMEEMAVKKQEAQDVIDAIEGEPGWDEKYAAIKKLERKVWRQHFINAARELLAEEAKEIATAEKEDLQKRNTSLSEIDGEFDVKIGQNSGEQDAVHRTQAQINEVALQIVAAYDAQQKINQLTAQRDKSIREKETLQSLMGIEVRKIYVQRANQESTQQMFQSVKAQEEATTKQLQQRRLELNREETHLVSISKSLERQLAAFKLPSQKEVLELQVRQRDLDWELVQKAAAPVHHLEEEIKEIENEIETTDQEIEHLEEESYSIDKSMGRVDRDINHLKKDYDGLVTVQIANVTAADAQKQEQQSVAALNSINNRASVSVARSTSVASEQSHLTPPAGAGSPPVARAGSAAHTVSPDPVQQYLPDTATDKKKKKVASSSQQSSSGPKKIKPQFLSGNSPLMLRAKQKEASPVATSSS